MINDVTVTKAISERFFEKFHSALELDAAIVGAGPSGLVAAYYLAQAGRRVAVFESKLSIGGGIWGGGMLMNEIVVQDDALEILRDFGISYREYGGGYYTADAVHTASALAYRATEAGVIVINACRVEDVLFREGRVAGVVILWTPVLTAGLHVDPLSVGATTVLDATGHAAEVVHVTVRKMEVELNTETGGILGERSMWAESGEQAVIEHTGEVFPGLYVAGMAAAAVHGGHRMGPIFGGMLISGKKVAGQILESLGGADSAATADRDAVAAAR